MYFAWQRGYGSLTVGERLRAAAIDYVLRQKEHHQPGRALPLKARLVATDRPIERAIYRLYGLTEEEIAVVEGKAWQGTAS